jgi:uncharacterized protein YgiM (DUF1202 family)
MHAPYRFSRRSFLARSFAASMALAGGITTLRQPDRAIAQAGDYELVSDYNGVRVRSSPSLSGAVVGVVNAGDVVSITGQTVMADGYSWIPVWVHGTNISGYVAGQFFRNASGSQGWFRGTPVFVNTSGVNLRAGAGLGYRVIGNFGYGTSATVNDGPRQADGYAWYHITIDGLTGWMAASFLTMGYVDGPSPSPGQFPIGSYVRSTASLNLRSNPGTGNSVIKVIYPEDTATVVGGPQTAGGYTWYQLEMWDQGATTGWAAGEYLEGARFEPTGARHEVIDGPLNLREWGSLGAPVLTTIPTGGIFVIADASFGSADGYTWAQVSLESNSSVRGWVALGFSVEI